MTQIPETQTAVQLTGSDELTLNENKEVYRPGPYQILCRVETVGLCFSDLKLLKQFSGHVRKSPVVSGIDLKILDEIPSYKPKENPTVPGHEAVVTVLEVGEKVTAVEVGARYLVQADWRWIRTANSNGAFGYNFEGALQEYNLLDERIIMSPDGECMLIPVTDDKALSASSIALCEPWACVEDAYAVAERRTLRAGGKLLIVADTAVDAGVMESFFSAYGKPGEIMLLGDASLKKAVPSGKSLADLSAAPDHGFDDVIYFGSDGDKVEKLFAKVAANGLINIVQCGGCFGRDIDTPVGRVHYGPIRIVGTVSGDPAEAMKAIPADGEIRGGDNINVVGAAGPMGVMHVIRNLCQGVPDVTVFGGDLDDDRLAQLTRVAKPVAKKNELGFMPYNSKKETPPVEFDYEVIMAPVPALVAAAVKKAAPKGIINIFAGIPADKSGALDLDRYILNRLYMIGTSGSTMEDMKTVLAKVESGSLDTDLSVGAISGLGGAVDGIRAVENRTIPGKILVYPKCKSLPLVKLDELQQKYPQVAAELNDGFWCKKAEDVLLKTVN